MFSRPAVGKPPSEGGHRIRPPRLDDMRRELDRRIGLSRPREAEQSSCHGRLSAFRRESRSANTTGWVKPKIASS